jgi:23S rRNA pseudouridine955/2504/2580 synthase
MSERHRRLPQDGPAETPSRGGVQLVPVGPEQAGQRIDNFLATRLKGVPKSRIYRILRRGEVRVNRGRVRPDYRLVSGDQVRIPPLRMAQPDGRERTPPGRHTLAALERAVLYEDERLLALDKPAGLAVHGGSGVAHGVIEALRAARPEARFLELVHRLDRDTSGCLLIAKRRSALRALHEALREGRVEKTYLTLLAGHWQGGSFDVTAPLARNQLRSGERVVRVDAAGKASQTTFAPRELLGHGASAASLMEVRLGTGRTHQIRVHAQHIGHPMAGDEKYGDDAFNRTLRALGLRRLFLHAARLVLPAPPWDERLVIEAPLPRELRAVLEALGRGNPHAAARS